MKLHHLSMRSPTERVDPATLPRGGPFGPADSGPEEKGGQPIEHSPEQEAA
jgi:hypothetical protein